MSIEFDIYKYLKADTTLDTLLGSTATQEKIFPIRSNQGITNPCIVYTFDGEGGVDEILDSGTLTLRIITNQNDYKKACQIRDRLGILLDKQDSISITSSDFYIYWCKKNGGSEYDDPDTKELIKVVNYDLKFQKIGGY
jgi:PKD repeat protein